MSICKFRIETNGLFEALNGPFAIASLCNREGIMEQNPVSRCSSLVAGTAQWACPAGRPARKEYVLLQESNRFLKVPPPLDYLTLTLPFALIRFAQHGSGCAVKPSRLQDDRASGAESRAGRARATMHTHAQF